jgi:SAM-dependent methyltransferase
MSWNQVWEDKFQRQSGDTYPEESFIRFVAKNFYQNQPRSQVKILEIGCGSGANIWYLAREGFDAYGIDGSSTAIAKAQALLTKEDLSVHLQIGDIIRLPYADGQFDAVADICCLTHNSLKDTPLILAEIKRILKPQGLLYSRTFTDLMSVGTKQRQLEPLEYTDISDGPFIRLGSVRLISKEGIQQLYGSLFRLISVDYMEYSQDNEKSKISEWVIYAQKE